MCDTKHTHKHTCVQTYTCTYQSYKKRSKMQALMTGTAIARLQTFKVFVRWKMSSPTKLLEKWICISFWCNTIASLLWCNTLWYLRVRRFRDAEVCFMTLGKRCNQILTRAAPVFCHLSLTSPCKWNFLLGTFIIEWKMCAEWESSQVGLSSYVC